MTAVLPVVSSGGPCVVCGLEIQPGQLWVAGPKHVFCDPRRKITAERLEQAARRRR